ncbi:MAG: UvrD-helicase domain-containing protein [Bacteriovorax sp.]|jgi:ATP-dependent exoDNAse (exonuclease V) beta subunit
MISEKKVPNPEQEKAIFHSGGKLLSAGAGSGKTFVLIEHLIYLLSQIQSKTPAEDWNKLISSELSKIVLMTFTKKAAGEMSVRMMKRVENLLSVDNDDSDNLKFWSLVHRNLSSLNITTIHGFCHRLLRMGFWNEFPAEINLVSSIEHKAKIQKLFDKWFKENNESLESIFLASSDSLLKAMIEIFSSPELRVLWISPKRILNANDEIDEFFAQLLDVTGYKDLFQKEIDLTASEKEKSKKWFELLIQFNEVKNNFGMINSGNFNLYNDFFKTISRFPITNSKEILPGQKLILSQIRELKEDLKNLSEDLTALMDNFEIYKKWVVTIANLFQYIDSRYFEVDGFSFSDLEYYALKGLKQAEVLSKVQESFSYFIIDEFQDTSFIQFEILKTLIAGKSEKIFCVGDKKQAIYGFRGGELQVFSECAELLGSANNYHLKNNFRSLSSIIDFNNILFEQVFPLGLKFEGSDPHGVEMETQIIPATSKSSASQKGEIKILHTEITGDRSDMDLDYLESLRLGQHVKQLVEHGECRSICILYRKLKPSEMLLEYLLENELAFSAQIKIQYADDPLINIFLFLIEFELNRNDPKKKESTIVMLRTLLSIIGSLSFDLSLLDLFSEDQKLLGLRLAFHKFICSLGISNSLHGQNSELIDAVCRLTKEDKTKIYHLLRNDEDGDYACDMMSGEAVNGNQRIVIMSAHASKGLEFDAVLLAGVHTNGRYNGMKDHIGKFPHSFKWKKSFDQKRFYKSPFYHLEAQILALKDFSESKRLLYVACTRAVKHLAYVDLWTVEKEAPKDLYLYDNSWIQALRLVSSQREEGQLCNVEQKRVNISLLQKDPLGIMVQSENISLGLISELSVTRLATIADCPFKFYLQNICKIEGGCKPHNFNELDDEVQDEDFYSSKKRGTEVHSYLSRLFLNQIQISDLPEKEKEKILWALKLAESFRTKYEVISERMIKFSFFGQMISGTPDLIFVSGDEDLVVWDFKTGIRNPENEESYWFQLMSYAFAYANLKQFTPDKKLEISLLYLDQTEIVSKNFSVNEITQILFSFWKKTEFLNQVNPKHCSHCDYSNICRKGLL